MTSNDQSIIGLEKAYSAVFNRMLKYRVKGLLKEYGESKLDIICTELNPGNTVPCFWKVSELARHYGYIE